MRTEIELLKTAIDNFYIIPHDHGLCLYINLLKNRGIISCEGFIKLSNLIHDNILPYRWWSFMSFHPARRKVKNFYFWKPGRKKPRLRYLKYLYEKL